MSTQMAAARRTLRSCALQVVPSTNVGTTDHGRHMRAAFWDVLRRAAMIAGFPYAVHFGRALRARPRYTNYETRARLYLCVHLDIVRHARRGQVDHKVETSAPTTYGPRQPPPRCIAAARGRGVVQSDSPVRVSAVEPLLQKTYAYLTNVMQNPYS